MDGWPEHIKATAPMNGGLARGALRCLAGLLALVLGSAQAPAAALEATLVPGQLRVGMDISYPPLEYYQGSTAKGFDVELATALAKHLGLQASFHDARLPNLVLGLMANHFDTVISALYILPARLKKADAIPYVQTGAILLVARNATYRPTTPEALCGHRVGLQMGTTWIPALQKVSDGYCRQHAAGPIQLHQYPTSVEVSQALLAGHLEAQLEMDVNAKTLIDKSQGRLAISSPETLYPQTLGIYVKKGNKPLLQALEKALAEMKANGEYQRLLAQYDLTATLSEAP